MSLKNSSGTRRSKRDRPATLVRRVVAENVAALMHRKYAALTTDHARIMALSKDAGIAKSQLYRILAADRLGCSIDYIEWLAAALNVRPQDLLTPYFAAGTVLVAEESERYEPRPPARRNRAA